MKGKISIQWINKERQDCLAEKVASWSGKMSVLETGKLDNQHNQYRLLLLINKKQNKIGKVRVQVLLNKSKSKLKKEN